MRGLKRLSVVLLGLAMGTAGAGEYKIGVLAKNGPAKAVQQWAATAEYLDAALPGEHFTVVPLDFAEVFPAVEKAQVDFFLVNSSMFVTAQTRYGAAAVATMVNSRQGKPLESFGGVIFTFVTQDGINTLEDLKGKTFMAVDQTSFGGWQMAWKELKDHGIDPTQDFAALKFGGKHDNVVFAVQNGEVDAGTVRTDTLERMAAAGDVDMAEIKVINARKDGNFPFVVSTTLYPEWPFARVAGADAALAGKVAKALIDMPADSPAAKNAKVVGWVAPLDYGPVAALQQSLGLEGGE